MSNKKAIILFFKISTSLPDFLFLLYYHSEKISTFFSPTFAIQDFGALRRHPNASGRMLMGLLALHPNFLNCKGNYIKKGCKICIPFIILFSQKNKGGSKVVHLSFSPADRTIGKSAFFRESKTNQIG